MGSPLDYWHAARLPHTQLLESWSLLYYLSKFYLNVSFIKWLIYASLTFSIKGIFNQNYKICVTLYLYTIILYPICITGTQIIIPNPVAQVIIIICVTLYTLLVRYVIIIPNPVAQVIWYYTQSCITGKQIIIPYPALQVKKSLDQIL